MIQGTPIPASSGHAAPGYSYPGDLARFVRDRWRDAPGPPDGVDPLPDAAALEGFFAACYQASMLREEERPVVFRAVLAEPALFDPEGRPPEGLQRLAFPRSLPFDPRELRRLSVAADPQRTLIGARRDGEAGLRVWGLINSGTRWLRDVQGGRRAGAPLPPAPVVRVDAPGSIEAYKGHELVGKLQGGRLSGSRVDPFDSAWLPDQFSRLLEEFTERHEVARSRVRELSGERWAPLEPTLPRRITRRMMQRVVSVLRDARAPDVPNPRPYPPRAGRGARGRGPVRALPGERRLFVHDGGQPCSRRRMVERTARFLDNVGGQQVIVVGDLSTKGDHTRGGMLEERTVKQISKT